MKPKVNAKACSVHIDADLRDEHGLCSGTAELPLPNGEREQAVLAARP